jgi:hypothetical protein
MFGGVLASVKKYLCNVNCTVAVVLEIESSYLKTQYAPGTPLPGTARGYDGFNSNINRVGAAFIVLKMLRDGPNSPGDWTVTGTPSIAGPPSGEWLQWEQIVNEYSTDGLINWNDTILFGTGDKNTAYSSFRAPNDMYNDDVIFPQPNCGGVWAQYCGAQNVISFAVPQAGGGFTDFYIRKLCANPLADIAPVPPITPSSACDVAATQIPQGGGNSVEAGSSFVAKIVMDNPVGYNTTWKAPSYGLNFPGSPSTPIGVSGNIYPGNPGTFFVPLTAQATPGVQSFSWQMEVGGTPFGPTCTGTVNVYLNVYPYLSSSGGDVQAGGAVGTVNCSAPAGSGSINAKNNQGSAQYIVSANGSIQNFGSANVPPSSSTPTNPYNRLTFGNQAGGGSYGSVCRPNLVASIMSYASNNPGNTISIPAPVSGTTHLQIQGNKIVDLDTGQSWDMTTFNQEVVDVAGNVVLSSSTGSATIQGKWTLFASGTITIDTNLTYASTNYANLPSLGIISGQDIDITHNTSHIDGFLFANTTLNTCSDVAATGNSCDTTLTVNGMMMANKFVLNRTSNAANKGTLSEAVSFVGQMFAVTPPGFSNVVVATANHSQFTGESPPLY